MLRSYLNLDHLRNYRDRPHARNVFASKAVSTGFEV